MLKRLGILNMLRLLLAVRRERARIAGIDLSPVRSKGLEDEYFISYYIQQTAVFSAMSRLVGKEGALAVHEEVAELVTPAIMSVAFPTIDQIRELDDPSDFFKEYIVSMLEADKGVGLHDFRVIEDSEEAFAFDITYCAFAAIPRQLGFPEACIPNCYSDEVFFPDFLRPLGFRFVRTGTIACGNDRCDFRFERI